MANVADRIHVRKRQNCAPVDTEMGGFSTQMYEDVIRVSIDLFMLASVSRNIVHSYIWKLSSVSSVICTCPHIRVS